MNMRECFLSLFIPVRNLKQLAPSLAPQVFRLQPWAPCFPSWAPFLPPSVFGPRGPCLSGVTSPCGAQLCLLLPTLALMCRVLNKPLRLVPEERELPAGVHDLDMSMSPGQQGCLRQRSASHCRLLVDPIPLHSRHLSH